MYDFHTAVRLIGRGGIAAFFLLAGLNKIMNPSDTQTLIADGGLAPVVAVYILTILFEITAGALLLLGGSRAAPAAVALACFCILTNIFFHRFWELDGPIAQLEFSLFFKNLAIAFALLYIAAMEWSVSKVPADGKA